VRTEKTVVCDLDPPVKISAWMLSSSNPHAAIVCNEIHVMTNGDPVSDRDKIWFTAEREQIRAEDLYAFAYFRTPAAEVPDGIPV
jgi:hypothetical protein